MVSPVMQLALQIWFANPVRKFGSQIWFAWVGRRTARAIPQNGAKIFLAAHSSATE
ncbi:hypothetical protein JJC00_15895 [Bradyrhizobium diazoefficiens]|uniref:hypothetical protein n=1 Tax=Bradyrhizobium diazoefficiens TaxID=1355477 RepID=UPI00190D1453|nr:hypothetical protein [Bradyrhizobium diazoefficiens]QQO36944.1 hypothetical protein JJC00_15895 [Bradyrhizobium diazoefficiens]